MADKFPSTLLVSLADKLAKLGDEPSRRDVETEIRKADLDLLDKLNQLAQQASSSGPFVPLLPNPIISGEPSLGTPHARVTTLLSTDPADTNWHAIDVVGGGAGPSGTKAIFVRLSIKGVTQGRLLSISNSNGGSVYAIAEEGAINTISTRGSGIVPLDASGQIWWSVDNADVTLITIVSTVYYI